MFVILNWLALRLWSLIPSHPAAASQRVGRRPSPRQGHPGCDQVQQGRRLALADDGTVSAGGIALQEGEYPGGAVWYDLGTNQKITLAAQRI
jgi:hypothetical protein